MTAGRAGFAPAKVNLTLHVTGRRADGYHLLDSLVVFAGVGDDVQVAPSDKLSLRLEGPQANGLRTEDDNLILRAARFLNPDATAALTLTKRLPVASGIGGGSADAAAALRLLARFWDMPEPAPDQTLSLGSDVPVCMNTYAQRLRGVGDILSPVLALPPCDIVLVNPGVSVSTPAVFKNLAHPDNPPMPAILPDWSDAAALAGWLTSQRNDLTVPTTQLVPEIATVLAQLADTDCLYSAMSGSGATCFALFPPDGYSAKAARARLCSSHPDWWSAHSKLL